ncbi:MAG: hypothetical protein QW728_06310, partial [Thermoplasmata archaeon]
MDVNIIFNRSTVPAKINICVIDEKSGVLSLGEQIEAGALKHYFAVIDGKEKPYSLIVSGIFTALTKKDAENLPFEAILKEHEYRMKEYLRTVSAYQSKNCSAKNYEEKGEYDEGKKIKKEEEENRADKEIIPNDAITLLQLKSIMGKRVLAKCNLCEHNCRADRLNGERGVCRTP